MNVLMVSTSYPRDASDWRGIFIFNVAGAVARLEDVRLALWAPPGNLPPHVTAVATAGESRWLGGLMDRGGVSHLMRERPLRGLATGARLLRTLGLVYRRRTETDLYHVNWLQCALPLPDDGKPALITVLGNDMMLLKKLLVQRTLRRAFRRHKVAICPNAAWMEAPLRAAFGDIAEVAPVPFGIDSRWYAVERRLDPSQPRRWLVVTRLTANKLGPLFDWAAPLFRDGVRELHLFGPMQETVEVPSWIHYHGPATAAELAERWFPSAWGLVTLSRHAEGRPQVMLEAMAAGLPIVASRMQAHADIVFEGETGTLCDSPDDYARALLALEDPAANQRAGTAARAWAASHVGTWDDCAQRYARVYRRLTG
jgi:glycosyltransferase involved in cell wall biosynthesis